MQSIRSKLLACQQKIPNYVKLVAVSKTKPIPDLMEAYAAGQRIFGENKIQELVKKYEQLPKDIQWHMIGHIQTNKLKRIAPFVDLIHAVDRPKLLQEIDKHAKKNKRVIRCLLQIKIAAEEHKFGLSESEALAILQKANQDGSFPNVAIDGLMGMATFTDDPKQIQSEFASLQQFYNQMQQQFPNLSILSMGMSGDYKIAIAAGSTMVRIGSAIFGNR